MHIFFRDQCLPLMLHQLSAVLGSPSSVEYAPVLPLYAPTSTVSPHNPEKQRPTERFCLTFVHWIFNFTSSFSKLLKKYLKIYLKSICVFLCLCKYSMTGLSPPGGTLHTFVTLTLSASRSAMVASLVLITPSKYLICYKIC